MALATGVGVGGGVGVGVAPGVDDEPGDGVGEFVGFAVGVLEAPGVGVLVPPGVLASGEGVGPPGPGDEPIVVPPLQFAIARVKMHERPARKNAGRSRTVIHLQCGVEVPWHAALPQRRDGTFRLLPYKRKRGVCSNALPRAARRRTSPRPRSDRIAYRDACAAGRARCRATSAAGTAAGRSWR